MLKRIKGFTLIELLIVVAIIAILAAIAVPNFLEAQTRSKVSRVQADLRSLATCIESYYVDNNSYPMQDSSMGGTGTTGFGANNIPGAPVPPTSRIRLQPTFRNRKDQNDTIFTLTTPISYCTSYFSDPFANTKRATFSYSRGPSSAASWIMWSFGPNSDENGGGNPGPGGGDIGTTGSWMVDTNFYDPAVNVEGHPTGALLNATYDPTNGTTSKGDVWRAKQ